METTLRKATQICFFLISLVVFCGCPDRSMLRPYPDLSKQSDTDSEEALINETDPIEPEGGGQ
jgi:hypothetical protein